MEIKQLKSGTLYHGDIDTFIPRGKHVTLVSTDTVLINTVDIETGELKKPYLVDVQNLKFKSPGYLSIKASKKTLWSMDFQDHEKTVEKVDSVPVEQAVQEPLPILERMQQMIKAEVIARYGQNSEEAETLEDAMDFDLNDDGHIGSPYEETELEIIPSNQIQAELQEAEPKADNPAQVDIEEEIASKTDSDTPQD